MQNNWILSENWKKGCKPENKLSKRDIKNEENRKNRKNEDIRNELSIEFQE